ncbi:MAG: ATP-dependent RNA helicase RhlB [bacterium]
MTDTHLSDIRFNEFDLPPTLSDGIEEMGFKFCTPIQASTIPIGLEGKDLSGQAQTGTGKTAAFLTIVYAHILRHSAPAERKPHQPLALIIAPTRELAIQIHKDAEVMGKHTSLRLGLVYGGVDYEKQRRSLQEGTDILIGTPGRLIDYFKQGVFDLRALQAMVLDEADRMFDLGFIKDLRFLLRRMPPPDQRLSMLFSATLSFRVMELAYEHMNNPVKVEIASEQVTADRVKQKVFYPANDEKIPLLIGLFNTLSPERSVVFTNTKHAAEKVSRWLTANGHPAALLSGDVPQKKRQRLLQEFSEGKYSALVATDVAARGLHIPSVSHVFNYDLPQIAEDYVHRIGRTARAGSEGEALSFACEDSAFYLPEIEAYIEQKLPVDDTYAFMASDLKRPPRPAPRKRPSHGANKGRPAKGRGQQYTSSKHQGSKQATSGRGDNSNSPGKKRRRRRKPKATTTSDSNNS